MHHANVPHGPESKKTVENLAQSFRWESVASAKFMLLAKKAKKINNEPFAQFLFACSHSELIHAARFARVALFHGMRLKTTLEPEIVESLPAMIDNIKKTKRENIADYHRFRLDAEADSCASAIRSFDAVVKADETIIALCDKAAADDYWKNTPKQFFVCSLCGMIREQPADECPACGAKVEMFIRFPKTFPLCETTREDSLSDSLKENIWSFGAEFPNVLDMAIELVENVTKTMSDRGWSEKDVFAANLAMMEAVANAVEHGNAGRQDKKYFINGAVSDHFFFCSVRDEGDGFDPNEIPDPTSVDNLKRYTGRGLMLIRGFMNRTWFNPKGNIIFMEKSRP